MSCQLCVLSRFQNIASVKKFFFPASRDSTPDIAQSNEGDENWEADWGWNEDANESADTVESTDLPDNGKQKWFQECILSLSPTNDMVAIAHGDKIVVLAQKWDPKHKGEDIESKFSIQWQNSLKQEESETITALMCLPLASQKRSTQGGPDWTCVIVGFSSGYIRMYTETGVLLLSQLLHAEAVQKLKCRTYEPPRFLGMSELHEELVILYKRAVVSIDGFSLFQSLRACRNQVARATASGSETMLQPPPLAYKKWALQDQDKINDLVSSGVQSSNPFDQMKTASLLGGFSATVKTSPPAASIYLTAGVGPYVGFFHAMEGSTQPILSDVAMAVANKIKTALMSAASGWLGFGGRQKDEAKDKSPKIEPATPLPYRYGLPDQRRTGDSLSLSPSCKYAAFTDGFGRVTLVDVERGIAIRMWKGYRDAQVGWIQVREDDGSGSRNRDHSRVAQFLVIYAPRRGILEVWTAANGPRVAAFNVSKWCQLVCPSSGMMGLNNVTSRGVKSRAFQCALVDPEGFVKTLEVPFHLALSDKSSKRARDLHLLKKLKAILKENAESTDSLESTIKDLILDMRISNITKQAVERVLSTKYLSSTLMKNVLKVCIQKISGKADATLDIDSKLFLRFCQAQDNLLHTYKMVEKFTSRGDVASGSAEESNTEMVARSLGLTWSEAQGVVAQLDKFSSSADTAEPRVKFKEQAMAVSTFLHCFTCHLHCSDHDSSRPVTVSVHKGLSEDRRLALAHLFFHSCCCGEAASGDVSIVLQDANLPADQIIDLLLVYWMSSDERSVTSLPNLMHLIKTVTAMTDKSEVLVDHNIASPWWQKIRDVCCHSQNIRAVYILALAARAVAMEIFGSQTKAKDPDADTASLSSDKTDMSEWESLAVDMEHWNLLIKQLEDVLALSFLIHLRLPANERSPYGPKPALDPIRLSVLKLLEGGRGSISEVVAQYIIRLQLQPQSLYKHLLSTSTDSDDAAMDIEPAAEATEAHEQSCLEKIQDHLAELRVRFPHSLENDILLSNCCWEYAVQWNKDPELISYLQLSLEYLKLVQNAVLRQGLCSMMWHMYVLKRVTAAATLMEKVGKAPKERLCRKDVGMSDATLISFMENVADLLQVAMDANCEANEVPVFNLEQLWQQIRGPASLVELAVDQKATNYHLVRHHYHLAVSMHAVMLFNMKSVKVLSLFDTKGRNSFFKDLHSHPLLPNQNVDSALSVSRRTFLCKVISEAISTLEKRGEDASVSPRRQQKTVAFRWPVLAVDLGKDFGLDIDYLKRHHVCQLYSAGRDKLAEEVLLTVNDHELMGSQLLPIAGQRVAYFLFRCDQPGTGKIMSDMSPSLSTWLKQLDPEELVSPDAPMSDTALLLEHVANQLPEGYSEYNLAISLVELVQLLLSLSSETKC
ncbi:rab3 GTPase-activating protein non-catalytic subunit-like [Haliotis cracherodii]|uniref:rab3 GTPase-activating protein non-catalytic subunit-like n=1 Tax=Haliotis cracherodii TaxID=6455 RepID=UPI0039EC3D46